MARMVNFFRKNPIITVASTILVPVLILSLYLLITRSARYSYDFDYIALGISALAGLPFLLFLPVPRIIQFLIAVAVAAIEIFALFFYSLYFVCIIFGDCL